MLICYTYTRILSIVIFINLTGLTVHYDITSIFPFTGQVLLIGHLKYFLTERLFLSISYRRWDHSLSFYLYSSLAASPDKAPSTAILCTLDLHRQVNTVNPKPLCVTKDDNQKQPRFVNVQSTLSSIYDR